MRGNGKKLLALTLALVFCLSLFPTAYAGELGGDPDPCAEGHTWSDGVCTVCSAVCAHESYGEDGLCTVCGLAKPDPCAAGHTWSNGVCTVCSAVCTHESYGEDGLCTVCGLAKPDPCAEGHTWSNGVCTVCSAVCAHESYGEDGLCTVCGLAKPEDEPAPSTPTAVSVVFVVEPKDAAVTVYDAEKTNEDGTPLVIEAVDEVYSLLPGDYLYDVNCEGYSPLEKETLTVAVQEDPEQPQHVELTLKAVEPEPLPDMPVLKAVTPPVKAAGDSSVTFTVTTSFQNRSMAYSGQSAGSSFLLSDLGRAVGLTQAPNNTKAAQYYNNNTDASDVVSIVPSGDDYIVTILKYSIEPVYIQYESWRGIVLRFSDNSDAIQLTFRTATSSKTDGYLVRSGFSSDELNSVRYDYHPATGGFEVVGEYKEKTAAEVFGWSMVFDVNARQNKPAVTWSCPTLSSVDMSKYVKWDTSKNQWRVKITDAFMKAVPEGTKSLEFVATFVPTVEVWLHADGFGAIGVTTTYSSWSYTTDYHIFKYRAIPGYPVTVPEGTTVDYWTEDTYQVYDLNWDESTVNKLPADLAGILVKDKSVNLYYGHFPHDFGNATDTLRGPRAGDEQFRATYDPKYDGKYQSPSPVVGNTVKIKYAYDLDFYGNAWPIKLNIDGPDGYYYFFTEDEYYAGADRYSVQVPVDPVYNIRWVTSYEHREGNILDSALAAVDYSTNTVEFWDTENTTGTIYLYNKVKVELYTVDPDGTQTQVGTTWLWTYSEDASSSNLRATNPDNELGMKIAVAFPSIADKYSDWYTDAQASGDVFAAHDGSTATSLKYNTSDGTMSVKGNFAAPVTEKDADGNLVLKLYAVDNKAPYTVEYYYQVKGEYPETADKTDTSRSAVVGSTVSVTDDDKKPEKSGYVLDDAAEFVYSAALASDGTTVLRVYFKQQFTVTYTDGVDGQTVFADQVTSGIAYGEATPAFNGEPKRSGYVFAGWDKTIADEVTEDAVYTATWTPVAPTATPVPSPSAPPFSPKTGDNQNFWRLGVLFLFALLGGGLAVIASPRRKGRHGK